MFDRLQHALLISLLCGISAFAVRPAQAQTATVTPETFALKDGRTITVERGVLMVPEDRENPASRRIPLTWLRFKSTNPNPGAPIVYLAGGPGGSGIDTVRMSPGRQPIFLALTAVADVIALDQRGTGASNIIPPCAGTAAFDTSKTLNEENWSAYYKTTLVKCVAEWRAAGVAVEGYDTVQSADDIEDLRKALGAEKVSLWGISYGTHLALATMRRHPDAIDRVALASAEGMDQTVKLPAATDAALARIGETAVSKAVLGDEPLPTVMRRVHSRLDAEPATLAVTPPDGRSASFRADSFVFRTFAGGIAKNPSGIGRLAGLYAALDAGQYDAIAPMVHDAFLSEPIGLYGMSVLMDLSSGVSADRLKAIADQAPNSLLGHTTNFPMPQMQGVVPGLDLGADYRAEIVSDIPTLLFSGELDVRTPLEEQAGATAGLRKLTRIEVRGGGHDLFEAHPAVPVMLADFFSGKAVASGDLMIP